MLLFLLLKIRPVIPPFQKISHAQVSATEDAFQDSSDEEASLCHGFLWELSAAFRILESPFSPSEGLKCEFRLSFFPPFFDTKLPDDIDGSWNFQGEIHSDVPWFDRHFQIDLTQGLGIQNQPMVSSWKVPCGKRIC